MEHWLAVEQVQAPAVEALALRGDEAVRAASGNLHVGTDLERLVLEVRCGAFRDARHAVEVGKDAAPARQAGANADVEAFDLAVVEREYVVLGGLNPKQVLQFTELIRLLVGKVHSFAEVLGDIVEFPLIGIDTGRLAHDPWRDGRGGGRDPAIVVDRAVHEHLEILGVVRGRRLGVVERSAGALQRRCRCFWA